MPYPIKMTPAVFRRDLTAGLVVFLVALPLCLGVALASKAPLFSGVLAGIIGGMLVGVLSGSHTSVSGPAAGMTAVVGAQILALGSFQTFLLAVVLAGLIQIVLGIAKTGFIAAFVPSSVIKGLLGAIGTILVLKQIPHVLGHDSDPEGDMSFWQPDQENTFTEIGEAIYDIHAGAALIGILSLVLLIVWDRIKWLKKSPVPAPLLVVVLGVGMTLLFRRFGAPWTIDAGRLIQVPVTFFDSFQTPNFSQWTNPAVYMAAAIIAAVASLETLLNLEAVDKLDPLQRNSPVSRELIAQGIGNIASGLIGGLPITSMVDRSAVNIDSGGRSKLVTIIHGVVLLVGVMFLGRWLNLIPLSCLAAILFVTGLKLVNPIIVKKMWKDGWPQFVPFMVTLVAIVLTDLLIGVLIGLAVSVVFILRSSVRNSLQTVVEKHLGGDVVRIVLPNQVSFLNLAALNAALDSVPRGGHVLLDAVNTDYIDPDVLALTRDYKNQIGPTRGVRVSLRGFRAEYGLHDQTQYVDYSSRDLQAAITSEQVLEIFKEGNKRFLSGQRLTRDLGRQMRATAESQHPLAVVLSCIDSRTPAELIFDLGVGDIFSVRIAGNVTSRKILGSVEYACSVAGAKLVLVLGHTRCGAITEAVDLVRAGQTASEVTGCQHLDYIVTDVQQSVDLASCRTVDWRSSTGKEAFVNAVARRNVSRVVDAIVEQSTTLRELVRAGRITIVGAMYNVASGNIEYLSDTKNELRPQ